MAGAARDLPGHLVADGTLAMASGLHRDWFARLEQDVRLATTCHNGSRDAEGDRSGAKRRKHPRRDEVSRQRHDDLVSARAVLRQSRIQVRLRLYRPRLEPRMDQSAGQRRQLSTRVQKRRALRLEYVELPAQAA